MDIVKVAAVHCRVVKSVLWDEFKRELLWVNIPAGRIYGLDCSTHVRREWQLPDQVASIGLADDGRLVVAMPSGVYLFDRITEQLTFLVDPEPSQAPNRPTNRLNDGKVGPDGAFWVGSIHPGASTAGLYRVKSDGSVQRKISGLEVSNGLGFTGDGRTMFHSDSRLCWIDRYDLDPDTGELSNRTRIAEPGEAVGRPDSAAVDVQGQYWSAGVSAGVLNCFRRDGVLVRSIPVPPKHPTTICFGGEDMRSLYFGSARRPEGATDDCGDVFMMRVDVPGVPIGRFQTAG